MVEFDIVVHELQHCIVQQVHINILGEDLPTIFWELWWWRQRSCEIAVHT